MPEYGLIACFSRVGPTLVNASLTVRFDKNWEMEKRISILTFQKVAKTGNIWGKKSSGRLYRLPSNSFVPPIHFFCIQIIGVYHGKCGIVNGTYEWPN